jgi:phytanoyl-CoA hydroxylase
MRTQKSEIPYVDAQQQDQITEEQAQYFRENGFLVIRNVLVGEELARAQEDMLRLTEIGAAGVSDNPDYMYGKGKKSGKRVFKRVEYVVDKVDQMKVLMGHPFILRSVEVLQGPSFIPTWDSMVLKMPDEGIIVPWHRDAEVPEGVVDGKPIFNVDFYLDASDIKTCLWVIPGSNLWDKDKIQARIQGDPDFDTSDALPVILQAGDAIFHDITVLHGSPDGDGNELRRTVYFEFRDCNMEQDYGPHTPTYIPFKQQILLNCIERRKQEAYCSHEIPFEYRPTGRFVINAIQEPDTYRLPHGDFWRS